jgi:subtilase family serine protease
VDGLRRHSNATAISIPAGLSFVSGVVSMNDLGRTALHTRPDLRAPLLLSNIAGNVVGPGDFATIYNLGPLFTAGTTGAGVNIAVVGQTDIQPQDHSAFISNFNLAGYGGSFTVIHNGIDPGILNSDEELEADLDTQWSSATAPGANIKLVVSASSITTSGVDLSAQYIVDNLVAPVMTVSYGACEADLGTAGNTFYDQLWQQAASEGISVFVASGDQGPAGCDDPNVAPGTGKAVSGLASTIWNTSVGGTMFQEGTGSYWLTSSSSQFQATAKTYIPEAAWNESSPVAGLWASGGGASTIYPKPAWQVAAGVPADGRRDLPDLAFNAAADHDPYLVIQGGRATYVGGTSVTAPSMAGIMALVVQRNGPQGNPNFTLYGLAKAQYAGTGPVVFHDTTTGNTNVPGVTGFSAGPGYDLATGLGSLDATALVSNWVPGTDPITVTVATPTASVRSGQSVPFSGSATDTGAATLTYTWNFGDGTSATGSPTATHAYVNNGSAIQTFRATLTVSDGVNAQSAAELVSVTPTGVSATIALPLVDVGVLPAIPIGFSAGTAITQNAGATITGYTWNFGDGTTATGPTVSHVFQQRAQAYQVTLTATDSTGATGQASLQVIADLAAVMDVNGDGAIDVRDLLAISAAWGTQATTGNLNGLNLSADLNADGKVDDTDLSLWMQYFTPGGAP